MADVLANGERFVSTATDPRSKWPTIARGGSLFDNPEGADYPAGVLGDDETYSKQMYTSPKGDTFPVIQTTDGRVLAYPAMGSANDAVPGTDVPQVIVSGKLAREALLAADAADAATAQPSGSSGLPIEVFPDPVQFALNRPVNTAGQSAMSLSDTQRRMNYHAANEAARDAARVTIAEAIAENNPAKATAAAYNASQLRIDNRSIARTGLSKGGLALSVAVDQTMPPEFYFNKYTTAGASEFDVAARVAKGVGSSNGYVNGLGTFTKVLGPIGVGYGAYSSATNVMNASSANRPYVVAQEAGTWAGGWYGASWGMAGGVALAVALGSNPIGWGILAAGAVGGIVGGVAGSHAGAYAAGSAYKGVTSWIR
ncbi:MAG: hypothetical protein H7175_23630 [Burkholderiales bacterium]|nr:hypothetical protein [Anaerolineae bacterium]